MGDDVITKFGIDTQKNHGYGFGINVCYVPRQELYLFINFGKKGISIGWLRKIGV